MKVSRCRPLCRDEEIAANESDEFEVIEREKARKAFMINAQNERVTNKARERSLN